MTHSMTAFSREQNLHSAISFIWELKSVNHRYLDVSFRMPEAFRFLEVNLRNILRGQIHRGKLECQLKINDMIAEHPSLVINTGLVNALLEAGTALASSQKIADDLTVSHVLTWPGVVQTYQPDLDKLGQQVELVFQQALKQLLAARLVEGNALKDHVMGRVQLLNEEIIRARTHVDLIAGQTKEKLLTRLHGLQIDVMEVRVEQEIALMLARLEMDKMKAPISCVHQLPLVRCKIAN